MSFQYLHLKKLRFEGDSKTAEVSLDKGVNVLCGASDTGKSYFSDSIDFMLGGKELREIPQATPYAKIQLDFIDYSGKKFSLQRSKSGGDFTLLDLENEERKKLSQKHSHGNTSTLSGFLLDIVGLSEKRLLKNMRGETKSLSFRDIAKLIIVHEDEIQKKNSPFWDGQHITKTSQLATVKLLLTGVDDSSIVSSKENNGYEKQVELLDDLIADIRHEIEDTGSTKEELDEQITRLEDTISKGKERLDGHHQKLRLLESKRKEVYDEREKVENRMNEIDGLLSRFALLQEHYEIDLTRLESIAESGSVFIHFERKACPLCGAPTETQHADADCDGNVASVVQAASSEITKITKLRQELVATMGDLKSEYESLEKYYTKTDATYSQLNLQIEERFAPAFGHISSEYSLLIEKRAEVRGQMDLHLREDKFMKRREELVDEKEKESQKIVAGIPDDAAHRFSLKLSSVLKEWNFPGECNVHFDKTKSDFIIDGKPRGSRGKGLRAITHAAISISLLEFTRENNLAHTGFVVLDSPLLAYYQPEGDDDMELQGSDLKERFYKYLIDRHSENQIIIVENQHPPESLSEGISLTVFTGNPNAGRQGLL